MDKVPDPLRPGVLATERLSIRPYEAADRADVAAVLDACFGAMPLDRVVATTEHDNAPSIAVMRRLGMTVETYPDPEPAWFQVVGILTNPGERDAESVQSE